MASMVQFNKSKVRALQSERWLHCLEKEISESGSIPRKRALEIKSALDLLSSGECHPPLRARILDVERKLARKESQAANSCDAVRESEPPREKPARRNSTRKQAPAPMASVDVEETSSAERIQALLQVRKNLHEEELEREQSKKRVLLEDLVELTSVLKESTLGISQSVVSQNMQLEEMHKFAAENAMELERQKKRVNERRQSMSTSLWTNISNIVWLIAVFICTYLVILLLPKSSQPAYTCKATS